jgi:hypothetical protein
MSIGLLIPGKVATTGLELVEWAPERRAAIVEDALE